jgi:hypothetical protein
MKFIKNYIFFTVYLLCLLLFINFVLSLSLSFLFFPIYNWFNGFGTIFKIFILIFGIGLFSGLMNIIGMIGGLIVVFVDGIFKFELNTFQTLISISLFILNIGIDIKVLWDSFNTFNFWNILLFILCIGFIIGMNYLLVQKFDNKE